MSETADQSTATTEPPMPNWEVTDFRPAPTGWRVVYVNAEFGTHRIEDMPGWLVQERNYWDPCTRRRETVRRVVPAIHGDVDIWGAELLDTDIAKADDDLYAVLAPGQSDPHEGEIDAHVAMVRSIRSHYSSPALRSEES